MSKTTIPSFTQLMPAAEINPSKSKVPFTRRIPFFLGYFMPSNDECAEMSSFCFRLALLGSFPEMYTIANVFIWKLVLRQY